MYFKLIELLKFKKQIINIKNMKNYLKNNVIYQVYVRNFTKEGTFSAAKEKLDYIKSLGVDIVYLLPISPIGELNRKGDLGSPYSIKDYTKINPELGTLDDFTSLIKAIHDHGMKAMIDIVYNHTSRDSWIKENHPELKVKERFIQIVSSGNLMESNEDNFQLVFSDKAGQIYPYNKSVSKHYGYVAISSMVIDTLKAYDDYRLFYFAKPAASLIASGLEANDKNAYVGLDPLKDFSVLQMIDANGECSKLNARYTDLVTGEPYVRLGYAEQCLILAEAVLRGWIQGDISDYYNKGIRAAMKFIADNTPDDVIYHSGRPITDNYIDQYLQKEIIKLHGDFENQLKQIITQKYLAYYMQYPMDAYYEYRRTGYPVFPVNSATNRNTDKNKIPVRWMYPIREYDYNKESVEDAVQRQYEGIDDYNKLMWILR